MYVFFFFGECLWCYLTVLTFLKICHPYISEQTRVYSQQTRDNQTRAFGCSLKLLCLLKLCFWLFPQFDNAYLVTKADTGTYVVYVFHSVLFLGKVFLFLRVDLTLFSNLCYSTSILQLDQSSCSSELCGSPATTLTKFIDRVHWPLQNEEFSTETLLLFSADKCYSLTRPNYLTRQRPVNY